MPGIADIFRTYGPSYRDRFGQSMLPTHRQAIQDITDCRTEVMGGHVFQCNHCKQLRYAYHSCKNRSCPTCHEADRKAWLEKRRQERLPVPYFHAVFTLPKELQEIIRSHQKIGYALIMEAAALSEIFRATFMALIRKKLPQVAFPRSVWKTHWVVYCKSTNHTADKTLAYLARYVHQTAITNSRMIKTEQGRVTFRYKDSRERRWKTMTMDASEFMRRFLQHVLPRGFHKVRYYGLLSPRNRQRLDQIRRELTTNTQTSETETSCLNDTSPNQSGHQSFLLCPFCQKGYLIAIMAVPRRWRAPP